MRYKNKYRVESARLKNWDYASDGYYFITICTKNREWLFGNIIDGKMMLSGIGKIAKQCWGEIPNHFPFVRLDEFIIMPNHVHGIIIIEKPDNMVSGASVETQDFASLQSASPQPESPQSSSETQNLASLQSPSRSPSNYGPQSKNIASIVRGFKIGVTKIAANNDISFKWQSRFYDHIIRDDNGLKRIREYIVNNPMNWETDDEFKIR